MAKNKMKNASLFMAGSVLFTMMPQNAITALANDAQDKELFLNSFENNSLPQKADGFISLKDISIAQVGNSNKALKLNLKNKLGNQGSKFSFITHYDKNVSKGSKLEYDIIIPTALKNFSGAIKTGGIFTDSNFKSEVCNENALAGSTFKDLGNGFSKAHVISTINKSISNLYKVDVEIAGVNSDYSGDIYVDNLKVTSPSVKDAKEEKTASKQKDAKTQSKTWNFNDEAKGLDGWQFEGVYDYNNTPNISYDKTAVGSGSLKIDADYSKNVNTSWSEIKLKAGFNEKIDPNEYNEVKFNLYYNPKNITTGSFKTKFYVDDNITDSADIDLSKAVDAVNGLKKVPVTINYHSKNVSLDRYLRINNFVLSIVGANTDYKGALYIDDITLDYKEGRQDIYVDKTVDAKPQEKIDVSKLEGVPDKVKLVDSNAIDSARQLRAYLEGIGNKNYAIFGHQNDAYNKAGSIKGADDEDGYVKSDTKDVTGSLAGICGMDSLSFTTYELGLQEGDTRSLPKAAADIAKKAAAQGSIITLSCHMSNFDVVSKRPKINGKYDFSGYTPGITTGNVVERIMPGGDLNKVFTDYLDLIAEYGEELQKDNIPVIFRPFHENNGSWFWWGKAYCDAQAYKNLYAYTVEYLRDVKGIHNFLYVYSPNGTFNGEDDYLERYPGDEFVDIIAFDQYEQNPKKHGEDDWFDTVLQSDIDIVKSIAKKHGKLAACSEIGMGITKSPDYEVSNCAAPQYGGLNKQWYSDVSKKICDAGLPYFMTWANFNPTDNFYVPYMVSETKGQEMVNDFVNYYNEASSIFADGNGDFSKLNVKGDTAYEYGYIVSPISGNRIEDPKEIKAKVKTNAKFNDVKFIIEDNNGQEIDSINAEYDKTDGYYKGQLTKEILDKIGPKFGKIVLKVNGERKSASNYIFNMPEIQLDNEVVDDFEGYYGQQELVDKTWSVTNANGCRAYPTLQEDADGNHKLLFKYYISTEWVASGEGYTGIVKSKTADWTGYDALQLYIKPDGKNQKLVIQITCNGEDFEYYPKFTSTEGQILTIPFSEFKGKNGGVFDPSHIEKFGIWCNTIVPEGHEGAFTVDSSMEFDNIKAVKMSEADALKNAEEAVKKAEETLDKKDLDNARKLVDALTGPEKDALEKRLDEVQKKIDNGEQVKAENLSITKSGDNNDNSSSLNSKNKNYREYGAKTGDSQNFMLLALSVAGALSLCVMKILQKAKKVVKSK